MTDAPVPQDRPLVEFFQLVPNPRPPRRADRSVGGAIPVRALRYCEPMTSASAFGWSVFCPISFQVVFDGHDILWTYEGCDEWLPLTRQTAQYPNFSKRFDEFAPPEAQGFAPPFLTASFQPGGLQVWTGCLVRTAPGWSHGSVRCSITSGCSRPIRRSSFAATFRFCKCSRSARRPTPTNCCKTSP
jgi:hypothetical protein